MPARNVFRSSQAAILLGLAIVAVPQRAVGAAAKERSVVDVTVTDPSSTDADVLIQAFADIGSQSRLRLNVVRRWDEPPETPWPDDAFARVWIDARAPDRIDVRIERPHSGPRPSQPYERMLAREGSIAVVAEAVAQVMRAELDSIIEIETRETSLARADVPATPAPMATESPLPPAPPTFAERARGGFGLDLAAFGSEQALSARSGPVFGAGAGLAISTGRAPWRPGLWAAVSFDSRFDVQSGQVTFDVAATSFRLVATLEILDLDAAQLDLGLGGGLDLLRVAPLVVRSLTAVIDTATSAADPVATGQLVMRLRIAPQVSALLGFDLDYDWAPHATNVPGDRPGGGRSGTFEPWKLRPSVNFGLCVRLWGGGASGRSR